MKRLFDRNEQFNKKGLEFAENADRVLKRLIRKYSEQGYSFRDIELIIQHCTSFHCTMGIADRLCKSSFKK